MLFESAAGTYRSRSPGVLPNGSGSDGATGIRAIKEAGGFAIAQDPETAEFPPMPQADVPTGCIDLVVPLEKIGQMLMEQCAGKRAS